MSLAKLANEEFHTEKFKFLYFYIRNGGTQKYPFWYINRKFGQSAQVGQISPQFLYRVGEMGILFGRKPFVNGI
jgi:hypothetical protein